MSIFLEYLRHIETDRALEFAVKLREAGHPAGELAVRQLSSDGVQDNSAALIADWIGTPPPPVTLLWWRGLIRGIRIRAARALSLDRNLLSEEACARVLAVLSQATVMHQRAEEEEWIDE